MNFLNCKRLTALSVTGWLAALMALLIGLNACVPAPTATPPTASAVPAIRLTPETVSTPVIPAGAVTRLGFNVSGWT